MAFKMVTDIKLDSVILDPKQKKSLKVVIV